MTTSKEYGLGEYTFARGWFMVADASKVTDKPQAVRFFGQDFALYRGKASGKVVLLDAYCPHMGTHLARNSTSYVVHDGQVEGDSIRCPYHAWRFGADGKCNHIPYSDGPIPPAAKVRSWPVVESLGAIFVWHDPEGGEPLWDAPSIPEWDNEAWVQWTFDDLGVVNVHSQEIIDNITDAAHFNPVHGSTTKYFENEFRGHVATQRMAGGHRTLTAPGMPLLVTDTSYHGPGILISRMTGAQDSYIFIAHTAVDDGSCYVWHALLVKSPTGAAKATEADKPIARAYQDAALAAFSQDFEVWKYKRPCIRGIFLPSDGPFRKQRAWYRQFYNPRAQTPEILKEAEGIFVPRGMEGFPPMKPGKTLSEVLAEVGVR